MSRFHDEFFKQKGTRHDELVIKCVTDVNLRDAIIRTKAPERSPTAFKVKRCEGNDGWFAPGVNIERTGPIKRWDGGVGSYVVTAQSTECHMMACRKHPNNGGTCAFINSNGESGGIEIGEGSLVRPVDKQESTYNTEVVCKNGNFIVGYADIIFDVSWTLGDIVKFSLKFPSENVREWEKSIHDEWAEWFFDADSGLEYVRRQTHRSPRVTESVLVEAKPELKDIGSVIRQLKTYRDLIDGSHPYNRKIIKMVVVTYSSVSEGARQLMKNEGIDCITAIEG